MHKYSSIYLREIVYLSEVDQQVRLFSFFVTLFMLDYTMNARYLAVEVIAEILHKFFLKAVMTRTIIINVDEAWSDPPLVQQAHIMWRQTK